MLPPTRVRHTLHQVRLGLGVLCHLLLIFVNSHVILLLLLLRLFLRRLLLLLAIRGLLCCRRGGPSCAALSAHVGILMRPLPSLASRRLLLLLLLLLRGRLNIHRLLPRRPCRAAAVRLHRRRAAAALRRV
jgi:hypothetical protein